MSDDRKRFEVCYQAARPDIPARYMFERVASDQRYSNLETEWAYRGWLMHAAATQDKQPEWTALTDELPDPEHHQRVLIHTEGSDFAGEQYFDVKADSLTGWPFTDDPYYTEEGLPEEVLVQATHWKPHQAPAINPVSITHVQSSVETSHHE